jgi:hypothetical protein
VIALRATTNHANTWLPQLRSRLPQTQRAHITPKNKPIGSVVDTNGHVMAVIGNVGNVIDVAARNNGEKPLPMPTKDARNVSTFPAMMM